jgi:hypothetical protein
LERRLDEHQGRSVHGGEEKKHVPVVGIDIWSFSLLITLTELPQVQQKNNKIKLVAEQLV